MKITIDGITRDATPEEEADILMRRQASIAETESYRAKRAAAYPQIGDQLDMLYKDLEDGGTRFVDAIRAVKETYPKGE